MNKQKALDNLKEVRDIFYRDDVHYWLEAGTCLGAYREGDFIDHDADIDVGILEEDFEASLIQRFIEKNFDLHHIFGMPSVGFEFALMKRGIKIDVFLFYKKNDKRWHAAWKNGGRNGMDDIIKLVFDADLVEKTSKIDIRGCKFRAPSNPEEYLIQRYGNNWEKPNKNWNWATDPKCINNNFTI